MATSKKRQSAEAKIGAGYDRHDAARMADRVAHLQLLAERMTAERDEMVLRASEPYAREIDRIEGEIAQGLKILEAWAEANQEEFAKADSAEIGTGHRVGWRWGQWQARTRKGWTWDRVTEELAALPAALRARFLVVKTEPNRKALIEAREESIVHESGVEVVKQRRFYLEPNRAEAGNRMTTEA